MQKFIFLIIALFLSMAAFSQEKQQLKFDASKKVQIVDASCGECQFKLPGKSCDLAVRIDGKAYFVDGTKIDDHGDAHAKDGFCESVRKAEVQEEIVNNRFKATWFKLLPTEKPASGRNR